MDKDTFIETLKEIPLEENNCVSTYGSVDVRELLTTIDRVSQVPNYETLLKENNTLNKGIDELIKKYEDELENIHRQWGDDVFHYHTYEKDLYKEIIQDLKKLKGE